MNKILRYSLVCLLTFFCGSMFAETFTIDGTVFSSYTDDKSEPKVASSSPFTFSAAKNDGSTAPTYNANGKDVRLYAKGTFTISTSGDAMTMIVFNISTQGLKRLAPITASTGTIATQAEGDDKVTWTGSAKEVTFTVGDKSDYGTDEDKAGQLDFTSIIINTNGTSGGGDEATFDGPTVSSISEFIALDKDTEAKLKLSNALVTYVNEYNGSQVFVRDDTGAMVFDAKIGFSGINAGDKITCDVIGKRGATPGTENNPGFIYAMLKSDNTSIENLSKSSGSISYVDLSIDEAGDYICDAVVVKNATFKDGKAVAGSDEIRLYDRFQLKLLNDLKDNGSTYNFYGLIYDGGNQYGLELVITKYEVVNDIDNPQPQTNEISVAEALEIINALEKRASTSETYRVKGYVVGEPSFGRKDDGSLYGSVDFNLADTKGGSPVLVVFHCYGFNGENFTEETINLLKADDEVVIEAKLKNYEDNDGNTIPETVQKGSKIISINGQTSISTINNDTKANGPIYNVAGQRVNKAVKGVYIQNGKKFVVK